MNTLSHDGNLHPGSGRYEAEGIVNWESQVALFRSPR